MTIFGADVNTLKLLILGVSLTLMLTLHFFVNRTGWEQPSAPRAGCDHGLADGNSGERISRSPFHRGAWGGVAGH